MQTLAQIRESKGVMKKALANCINVTYPTWQKYEADPTLMTVGQLAKVCEFLGCEMQDVFLGSNLN